MSVLVVYASRHGATEGIAARIAARLVDRGASVDVRRVDEVEGLDAYDAVVFGAPVYEQSWPPEADRFGIADIRAAIGPREYRVFPGVIRRHQWPFWSRVFFHAFGGRFGDHRDWPVIDAWAERIARELPTAPLPPA